MCIIAFNGCFVIHLFTSVAETVENVFISWTHKRLPGFLDDYAESMPLLSTLAWFPWALHEKSSGWGECKSEKKVELGSYAKKRRTGENETDAGKIKMDQQHLLTHVVKTGDTGTRSGCTIGLTQQQKSRHGRWLAWDLYLCFRQHAKTGVGCGTFIIHIM